MKRPFAAIVLLICLTAPAVAARLDPAAINEAEFGAKQSSKQPSERRVDPVTIKAQILLDRALFSPGEIDGKLGENAKKALKAFAEANNLPSDKPFTQDLWARLTADGNDPVIVSYTIAEKDVKGPFLTKIPAKMEAMQDLKALSYRSPRQALAEKFHMSEELLSDLNPGKRLDQVGEVISVANVLNKPDKLNVARIEVDKVRQTVKAFDSSGAQIAFFPATVGSKEKPTPDGTLKVVSADANPTYRYDPKYKFKGVNSKKPFTIKPGPNNPVGSFWIGLSAEGYGLHGTPDPSKVSKAASHGCVRLTNWDAVLLGTNVKRGTPVAFVAGSQSASR